MTLNLAKTALGLGLILLSAGAPLTARAGAPTPTAGAAVVDGDHSEWNLATDFFSDMFRAGKPSKPIESAVYLRYDCRTETLYALVLAQDGVPAVMVSGTAWIAIDAQNNKFVTDGSGDDGVPPDFAWIDPGFDGDPTHARGYEASFHLWPGTYAIIVHLDVFDAGDLQTSGTPGFPGTGPSLVLACSPTAAEHATWSRIKTAYR